MNLFRLTGIGLFLFLEFYRAFNSFLSSLSGFFTEYRFKSDTKESVRENNLSQFALEVPVQNPLEHFQGLRLDRSWTMLVLIYGRYIGWLMVGIFAAIALALFMAIFVVKLKYRNY